MSGKPQASVPSLRQRQHIPRTLPVPPASSGRCGRDRTLSTFFFQWLQLFISVHLPPPVPVVSRCRSSPLPPHLRGLSPSPPFQRSGALQPFPFPQESAPPRRRPPGALPPPGPEEPAGPGLAGSRPPRPRSPPGTPAPPRAAPALPAPAPIGCCPGGRGRFVTSRSAVGRCRFVRGSGARSAERRGPHRHRDGHGYRHRHREHSTGTRTAPALPQRLPPPGTRRAGECPLDGIGAGPGLCGPARPGRGAPGGGGGGPGPLGSGPPAPVVCFFFTGLRLAVVPRSHWLRCGDVASFAFDIETSERSPRVPP